MKFLSVSLRAIVAAIFIAYGVIATPIPAGQLWFHSILLQMADSPTVDNSAEICNI